MHYDRPEGANEDLTSPHNESIRPPAVPSTNDTVAEHVPSVASGRARFVSDLKPESTLLNRPVPSTSKVPNDDIGVWVDRATWDNLIRQKTDANNTDSGHLTNPNFRHGQRPHPAVLSPLVDLFFRKIHPILPLLEEEEFRQNHASGIVPEPLVHAMCIVAAKDPEAQPHLRFSDVSNTVSPRQFCSVLHASVTGALRLPVRLEKVTLIRILALTSLHTEGPEGSEESSMFLAQAMHHCQTLGLHLGHAAPVPVGSDLQLKRLFWCLWALDRMSSVINGRPIVMADIDVAIESFKPGESGYPAFEAWLKITELLNKVIDLYRPTQHVSENDWREEWHVHRKW